MNRTRDIEQRFDGASERVRDRVRQYANDTADTANSLMESGRRMTMRLGRRGSGYGKQLSHMAEDLADEASYQYRRARRHASRHPVATVAVVAGTIGAFMLLRRLLRSDED
ncbi:hypothetical protein [Frateuria terrea]|uniref:Uncharacterized protein n=1 Tax=Frateuria terrea TaxID=529704 RepID=A0A1H6SFC4_9GAMM|nr:hypothetical protein [Frateuria terrea]SEI62740.1 hypothetical protein SAMN04487997_1245 [Frateuria terrea]SFP23617.1 hypothetical protein SAMN02927913_1160 [Frateuria terrea]